MLGLPDSIEALLFDMDGVLTQTAKVHAAAWKEMFDAFLRKRVDDDGGAFKAFDIDSDYDEYVDGKPRYDGVRDFLKSRDIKLPEGKSDDAPTQQTVHGLGNRKNDLVLKKIHDDGVQPYEGSVRYVHAAIEQGLKVAVVSSSANAQDVLKAAGISDLFETVVDGKVVDAENLAGKPAPDTFLAAAKKLGAKAADAAVFEDALSGVAAGHAGHFGFVVGVDRVGQRGALREHGADIVVDDLAELLLE